MLDDGRFDWPVAQDADERQLMRGFRASPERSLSGSTKSLHEVTVDRATVALRLLVDRHDGLGRARTDTINRLHKLLLELLPGGAKKYLSAAQTRALLATIRHRDIVGSHPPPTRLRAHHRTRNRYTILKPPTERRPAAPVLGNISAAGSNRHLVEVGGHPTRRPITTGCTEWSLAASRM